MVSCTEFIPAYSELFKFLEAKDGKEAVLKYWEHLAGDGLSKLDAAAREGGLKGVYDYFNKNLNEEAADFISIHDEDEGVNITTMRRCPSKGKLLELDYMEPYPEYCHHCFALYAPVLEKYGMEYHMDLSRENEAYCVETIRLKKK